MSRDDEWLLGKLAEAVRTAQEVPRDFVEAGKAAFAWRAVDAELAALTYDSADLAAGGEPGPGTADRQGDQVLAGTRSENAVLRALTFASPRLTVELQLDADGVLGQVSPPGAREAYVQPASGSGAVAVIDALGFFALRPVPEMPFRLRVRTGAGGHVLTGWIMP